MCVCVRMLQKKRLLQQTAIAASSPAPGTQKEDAACAAMGMQACVHIPVNEHVWAVTQAAIAAAGRTGRGGAKAKKAAAGPSPAAAAQKGNAAAPAPPASGKEPANFPGTVVATPDTPQTAATNSIPAVFPGGTSTSVSRSRCF